MKSNEDNTANECIINDKTNDANLKKSQCGVCGQKFRFLKALQKHEVRHQGNGGFVCRSCGMRFTSTEAREKHRDKEHKVLRCKICNIRYNSSAEYFQHINTLHDGRDRELSMCSECGKQFKTKGELTHHVSSKCGTVKKYQCSICLQTLMTAGSLHNHMLRHTGEHTFMCRFCAKTFLTAGQLTVHERIHTQEKAFVCEICNKGFCHRQSLITHSTLHTGIKPYQCEGCGSAFSCVGNLLKHRKTHSDTCGKIPLTTHRVKNPATKIKVQVNTPPTSKLRTLQKRKKIEETTQTQIVNSADKSWLQDSNNSRNSFSNSLSVDEEFRNGFSVSDEYISGINITAPQDKTGKVLPPFENELPFESSLCVKQENWVPAPNFPTASEEVNNLQENSNDKQILSLDPCSSAKFPFESTHFTYDSPLEKLPNENLSNFKFNQETSPKSSEENCARRNNTVENHIIENNVQENGVDKSDVNSSERDRNAFPKMEVKLEDEDENEDDDDDESWENDGNEMKSEGNDESDASDDSTDLRTRKLKLKNKSSKKAKNVSSKCRKKVRKRHKSTVDREKLQKFIEERGFDEEKGSSCKYCGNHYLIPLWLMKHEEKHEQSIKEGEMKGLFKCSCCNETFRTKEDCMTHQQCEHAEQLTCKECDRLFANPDSIKAHINFYHKGVPRKKYIYVCEKCGKVFKQKALLLNHEQSNCGEGPLFQCDVCEKCFTSKHVQKSHMRIHLPEKSLLCKFCGKSFHWKGQLKIHERSHTGERPFKCQYCPKAFAYRESLITHSTLHTGIKPHLCEACGSRFSCIGNLLKHRRTHANTCGVVSQVKIEVAVS